MLNLFLGHILSSKFETVELPMIPNEANTLTKENSWNEMQFSMLTVVWQYSAVQFF